MKSRQRKRVARKAQKKELAKIRKAEKAYLKELQEVSRPNAETSFASIQASEDEKWLKEFRSRMVPRGETAIVTAIDGRLKKLEEIKVRIRVDFEEMRFRERVGSAAIGLGLTARVRESLRVYELFLLRKHGRNVRAARTRAMIERWGEKEAVRRTVTNLDMSNGLELLWQYNRLDCSYEQIILDCLQEFGQILANKAKANLRNLPTA